MSVSPSSMYNIRHAIFFVEDRATLGHLSHLLNMRDTTDHALSQAAATYIHSIKPLLTKKINLLSGAEQTTNLQDSILSLKAQAIRCEILFIQTCNQNGISIDDQHLVDLYTSIQLMLPSLSDIDEEDRPELLRAMRIEFKIMHELADHQMAAHAQQDPLGSALVNLHERNNNYLELYIGDARPEALRQKAPQLDRELNRLEARIKSLPDSSRKQLYNFFHTSIRDRFAEKLVPFITIPKLIFSTITHNVDRTKSTNETAATREELQNGIIQAQKRMEEIKQALLTFRTTPDETMHLQGLMINMRIQHQFLTTKLSLSPNTSYNPSPTDTLPPSPFQAIIGNTEEEIMELLSLPEE